MMNLKRENVSDNLGRMRVLNQSVAIAILRFSVLAGKCFDRY
jgi:hypothetical protein